MALGLERAGENEIEGALGEARGGDGDHEYK
jgi:hypothetical protein